MFTKLSAPNSEEKIKQHWKYTDKVYISILCPCFNQESYISDAIEGFLAQECDYRFEIIIHDDASTDSTPEILKLYQARFPSIVKLVLQTENQYTQGKQISVLSASHAQGEYLALCEGDDFWIDRFKIHKQLNLLLKHSKSKLCFSKALALSDGGIVNTMGNIGDTEDLISVSRVILGGGGYMPTLTLFFHRDVLFNMPTWFDEAPIGDYYIQIWGSMYGSAVFLPDITSVYRVQAAGSWSSMRQKQREKDSILNEQMAHSTCINELIISYPNYRNEFIQALSSFKTQASYDLLMNKYFADFKSMIEESWDLFPHLNFLQSILFKFRYFPFLIISGVHCKRFFKSESILK